MVVRELGPRASRVYASLRDAIASGELPHGARLPAHKELADRFGVAPMTVRQVLGRLHDAGLLSVEPGRGTYVRGPRGPEVLVVASASMRATLTGHIQRAGHAAVAASSAAEAYAILGREHDLAVVIAEVGRDGEFVRAVRRRWPDVALVAVVDSPACLAGLYGAPEFPVLQVSTPVQARQLEEVLRFAMRNGGGSADLRFQSQLLEAVDQAIIATDIAGRIVYWNRGAERLYGWQADEVLGTNVGNIIVAPELMARGKDIMDRLRQGQTWSGEFPVRHRNGTQLQVLVSDSPVRSTQGELIGIIGVALDITERKHAEQNRLARARLETVRLATQIAQREITSNLQRLALTR